MVPRAEPDSRLFRDVVQLGHNLKALAEIKGSSKKPSSVAILWDWESWNGSEMDGHPSSLLDYFREAREWWVALLNLGFTSMSFLLKPSLKKPSRHCAHPVPRSRLG